MKNLNGKIALITGAASGIGFAMARRFAAEGMKLVLVDVEATALAAAEAQLRSAGATVLAQRADVAKSAELHAVFESARAKFGGVQLLCNNAGVGGGVGPSWQQSEADWEWTLSVNLWGAIHGTRLFMPALLASGEAGHIVNTSSMAGLVPTPFFAPYVAAKAAVVSLTEALKMELTLLGAPIGVSLLCPGLTNTKIASSSRNRPPALRNPPDAARDGVEQMLEQVAGQQAAAIGLPPDEVAELVLSAIRDDRFYVLTHPDMKAGIEQRAQDLLIGRNPSADPIFAAFAGMFKPSA